MAILGYVLMDQTLAYFLVALGYFLGITSQFILGRMIEGPKTFLLIAWVSITWPVMTLSAAWRVVSYEIKTRLRLF